VRIPLHKPLSPYITPLLARSILDAVEDGIDMNFLDSMWGGRISSMKFTDQSWSENIVLPNPGIFFISKTLPLYEIL